MFYGVRITINGENISINVDTDKNKKLNDSSVFVGSTQLGGLVAHSVREWICQRVKETVSMDIEEKIEKGFEKLKGVENYSMDLKFDQPVPINVEVEYVPEVIYDENGRCIR